MRGLLLHGRWLVLLLLAIIGIGFAGCASTPESENLSSRPWNAPQGWENSLPGAMYDRSH